MYYNLKLLIICYSITDMTMRFFEHLLCTNSYCSDRYMSISLELIC